MGYDSQPAGEQTIGISGVTRPDVGQFMGFYDGDMGHVGKWWQVCHHPPGVSIVSHVCINN